MKHLKVYESYDPNSDEDYENYDPNSIEDYIENFRGTIADDTIVDWIKSLPLKSQNNFDTIINFKNPDKIIKKYGNKLNNFTKLRDVEKELKEIYHRMTKLRVEQDHLSVSADAEYMYLFQKELLENNFDWLYEMFIKEELENFIADNRNNPEVNKIEPVFYDIHPKIRNSKEFRDKLELYQTSKKYNL